MASRSSSSFDEFANSLASEALSEAADNFFGRRVELEREEEHIREKATELQRLAEQALDSAALLALLLLDDRELAAFFRTLGVDMAEDAASALYCRLRGRPPRLKTSRPRALTRTGRYARLLEAAYLQAREAVATYLQGRMTQPNARGPKRLSLNYTQLKDWCDEHNCRIREANAAQAPSCVLGFCKQLIGDSERERVLGGGTHGGCNIDETMALKPLDFASLELPALPDLPDRPTLSADIRTFAQALHARRTEEVEATMRRVL